MSTTILLAAALQKWERYSAHALAARDVAATLAKGTAHQLHVLSVYDYPPLAIGYLPAEIASRQQEELQRRTDTLMVQKLNAYVAPLHAEGLQITPILRTGSPRDVIVQVATSIKADLVILGSHSKRGVLDIALGGTAQQVGKAAPCLVVFVSPKCEGSGGERGVEAA
jgi:nucleotide-binding universal stress UspA family protein